MFFSSFNELYEKIIFEAEYDTDKWQRFDTYKDIEIYYNIDHIKQRLANRYLISSWKYSSICNYIFKNINKK